MNFFITYEDQHENHYTFLFFYSLEIILFHTCVQGDMMVFEAVMGIGLNVSCDIIYQ